MSPIIITESARCVAVSCCILMAAVCWATNGWKRPEKTTILTAALPAGILLAAAWL